MKTLRGRSLTASIVAALCLFLAAESAKADDAPLPRIDRASSAVIVSATLHLAAFEAGSPPGHHLLTWAGGRAGHKALLRTPTSDRAVLDALEALGAKPGDTLREEAWTERADPKSRYPDAHATGAALEVTLLLPGGGRRPIRDLVEDIDRHGFAWRLAGNRKLISVWRSGCVICLQSCPGSKVANAKATMRDLHRGRSRFRPSALARRLGEGAKLSVELKLAKTPH